MKRMMGFRRWWASIPFDDLWKKVIMISHECKNVEQVSYRPGTYIILSVRNKRVVFVSGDPVINRSHVPVGQKCLVVQPGLLHLPFYYATEVDLSHEDWSSDWGWGTSDQPLSGMIHNKNQDSLCRSACTACLLCFAFFPSAAMKALLYNWKHCTLSPHHMYDFNSLHVEMFFGLGWVGVGGRCPFPIISLLARVHCDIWHCTKKQMNIMYDTQINYILFSEVLKISSLKLLLKINKNWCEKKGEESFWKILE